MVKIITAQTLKDTFELSRSEIVNFELLYVFSLTASYRFIINRKHTKTQNCLFYCPIVVLLHSTAALSSIKVSI